MANLKGSTFDRQIKNAINRLEARGTSRHGTDGHKTHSHAVADKREMYLRDFANYAEKQGLDGKLNTHMTADNMKNFLDDRLADVSAKTALDYTAGFNSMLSGLEETRVPIPDETKAVLQDVREQHREAFNAVRNDYATDRAIDNREAFVNDLRDIREESAVIAEIQLETGLRVSEALEVASNFNNYYNPETNELSGIAGKGGQEYPTKEISEQLAEKIENLDHVPAYSTYDKDLGELDANSHDLRITYAEETYNDRIENGYSHEEALKETSEELNHHRESITEYYLNRA